MPENKSGRRIIAIAVSPTAYDELLKLKGKRTWNSYLLHMALLDQPHNTILQSELDSQPKPKEPKAEKPKKEKKEATKGGAKAGSSHPRKEPPTPGISEPENRELTQAELRALEELAPSKEI
jgi:hypothetical protein